MHLLTGFSLVPSLLYLTEVVHLRRWKKIWYLSVERWWKRRKPEVRDKYMLSAADRGVWRLAKVAYRHGRDWGNGSTGMGVRGRLYWDVFLIQSIDWPRRVLWGWGNSVGGWWHCLGCHVRMPLSNRQDWPFVHALFVRGHLRQRSLEVLAYSWLVVRLRRRLW